MKVTVEPSDRKNVFYIKEVKKTSSSIVKTMYSVPAKDQLEALRLFNLGSHLVKFVGNLTFPRLY